MGLISLPGLLLAIASSAFSDSSHGHKKGSGNHFISREKKKSDSLSLFLFSHPLFTWEESWKDLRKCTKKSFVLKRAEQGCSTLPPIFIY